jgi:hypothetical protein
VTVASGRRQSDQNPDTRADVSSRFVRVLSLVLFIGVSGSVRPLAAQSRVGPDSADRLTAYGRNMAWMTAGGLGYATWDQLMNNPEQWGHSWSGYGKRVASNVGATAIQETVTEGIAYVMDRPVTYQRCKCTGTSRRVNWALRGTVTDQMPDGSAPIAVPRIVGGYVGAYARTTWFPSNTGNSRLTRTLIDGTTTLAVSAVINLTYEFLIRR